MYCTYCVIEVTPKQLKAAKWALLNVHLWTVVLDFVISVLSIPLLFFPAVSGVMLGYGQYIGIPSWFLLYSIQALVSVYASAATGLLENWQNLLMTKWKISRKWIRILLNVFNYMVACATVIPPYLENFDVQTIALEVLKVVPCPIPEFFDSRLFFVTNNPFFATMLMQLKQLLLCLKEHFTFYTLETQKMQFKFLIGSLAQMMIPFIVFMPPILYIWFSANIGYYD
ncbi:hypothetical protein L5515_007829 [Caenorhabditis briggsae]|uniref:Serpentine Receptor, class H n=1 Tax=Caenorhabditis briggsae TaxID=6238 RepID=A0AAE9JLG6_CAEBR|nr:hypothetical protein L5515_007829 [Caenorhabditis briggsae]